MRSLASEAAQRIRRSCPKCGKLLGAGEECIIHSARLISAPISEVAVEHMWRFYSLVKMKVDGFTGDFSD